MQLFYPDHNSVLQAEMLVAWKRGRGVYNFDSLPAIAIICVDYNLIKQFSTFSAKKLKGLKGRHFVRHNILFCSAFENGASGMFSLLEELRALGVQQFVFFGFAGIISAKVKELDIYIVDKAISASNVIGYYSDQSVQKPFDNVLFDKARAELALQSKTCVSIDTPFRETRLLMNEAVAQGAELVEMECAAVYAFGQFYQLPTVCFLIGADKLMTDWIPPVNLSQIQKEMKLFLQRLKRFLELS